MRDRALSLEAEVQKLKLQIEQQSTTAAEITPPPASADPPALKNIDSLKKPDRSKIISNLLLEVQEYDGRMPPRFFIQVAGRCLNTLDTLDGLSSDA